MTDAEREAVLEAVADGVLDALREREARRDSHRAHLTLAQMLEIANLTRRHVAAKLTPKPETLMTYGGSTNHGTLKR